MNMMEIGLFVNGPPEWYANLSCAFQTHGRTWLQQSRVPDGLFIDQLKELIRKRGYFYAFGYVQAPHSKVQYRFKIEDIKTSYQRIPPPDGTAPKFAGYDIKQGGCSKERYEYPMWLKVSEIKRIPNTDFRQFVNFKTRRTLGTVRNVVACPVIIPDDLIDIEGSQVESKKHVTIASASEELGISISLEKDLERFISTNLNTIEEGLRLYSHTNGRDGKQFTVSTGKIDLLCVDKNNKFVIIEIKSGMAGLDAYGQIKSYIAALKTDIAKDRDVKGIIIARDFDDKLVITTKQDFGIKLLSYNVKFSFSEVMGRD